MVSRQEWGSRVERRYARRVNSPPAVCRSCGWEGPATGIRVENSTNITFQGGSTTCARCGGRARIVSGTYDFIGGVVRVVRDADLSIAQLNHLRQAASQARRTGQSPQEFVEANPEMAPVINLMLQQPAGRDWLILLLAVLAIVIPFVQAAEYHAEDEAREARTNPTTLVINEREINALASRIAVQVEKDTAHESTTGKDVNAQKRPKRPGKTYGKNKRRR